MASDNTALALLGQSADWLKDCDNVTLGEYRRRVIDSLDRCWRHPEAKGNLDSLADNIVLLFQGLYYNQVYPTDAPFFVHKGPDDPRNFLPREEYLPADARALADTIVTNKVGIGEAHLDYILTLLQRRVLESPDDPEAIRVEEDIRNWLFLRSPTFRDMNLGDFSPDVKRRFLSLTPLRIARRIEAMGDDLSGDFPLAERLRVIDSVAELGAEHIGRYAPKPYRMTLLTLEFVGALEENIRARQENRESREPRSERSASSGLVKCWEALGGDSNTPLPVRLRMANLILTELSRAIPRVEPRVALRIYAKLRARTEDRPPVRHKALFEALPNDHERLDLLNFLYRGGNKNPSYYLARFDGLFDENMVEFVSKSVGFRLKPKQ